LKLSGKQKNNKKQKIFRGYAPYQKVGSPLASTKDKVLLKEKRQGQANGGACPCLSQRAESESRSSEGADAVERTESNRGLIAKAAVLPEAEQPTEKEAATLKAETLAAGQREQWRRRCNCRSRATVIERVAGESVRFSGLIGGGGERLRKYQSPPHLCPLPEGRGVIIEIATS